jgi:hypothetical protein
MVVFFFFAASRKYKYSLKHTRSPTVEGTKLCCSSVVTNGGGHALHLALHYTYIYMHIPPPSLLLPPPHTASRFVPTSSELSLTPA